MKHITQAGIVTASPQRTGKNRICPTEDFTCSPSGGWWPGCEWAAVVSTYSILIIAYTVFSPVAAEFDGLRFL